MACQEEVRDDEPTEVGKGKPAPYYGQSEDAQSKIWCTVEKSQKDDAQWRKALLWTVRRCTVEKSRKVDAQRRKVLLWTVGRCTHLPLLVVAAIATPFPLCYCGRLLPQRGARQLGRLAAWKAIWIISDLSSSDELLLGQSFMYRAEKQYWVVVNFHFPFRHYNTYIVALWIWQKLVWYFQHRNLYSLFYLYLNFLLYFQIFSNIFIFLDIF